MENSKDKKQTDENNKSVLDFLTALYGGLSSGFLSVTCIAGGDSGKNNSYMGRSRVLTKWFSYNELKHMTEYIESQGRKYSTYIGLNPRKKSFGLYSRGHSADVSALVAAYCDLDIKGPAHKEQNLPETAEEVYQFLNSLPLMPSIVVNSGNGIHAYWLLDKPMLTETIEDKNKAMALVKGWESQVIGTAFIDHGWRFDAVADLSRMLRAPGTINFKTKDHPESRIVFWGSQRYTVEDFKKHLPDGALDENFPELAYSTDDRLVDGANVTNFSMLGKGSGRELIDSCIFLQHCEDDAEELPEPHWHAAISNLALTADGEELCHEISKPYPKYSYAETEAKYKAAAKADIPITCDYIHNRLCFNCGRDCGVRAPISLIRNYGDETDEGETYEDESLSGDESLSEGALENNSGGASDKTSENIPVNGTEEAVSSKAVFTTADGSTAAVSSAAGAVSSGLHTGSFHADSFHWEDPIPFQQFVLPGFPVDALPEPIAAYVTALAEATQTPVDMAASCSIAIMSVCLQGKYKVFPKPDWSEQINTYVLNVMEPSERKSAVLSAMVRPIIKYEAEENQRREPLIEASKMQKNLLERRERAVIDQVAKGKATQDDIDKIAREMADFHEEKPLKLFVDDVTTEKLSQVMGENDGRAAIISTEGGIFDTLSGIYTKSVNIDVMLKGYTGDTLRVDRVGRASESVLNPCLTILLMAQPTVLSNFMANTTFQGRGLTARFFYCIPASHVGQRAYDTRPIPNETYQAYEDRIRNLLDDEYPGFPKAITLSPEANAMFKTYYDDIESKLKTDYSEYAEWAGKLAGNTARIAGLLERASQSFDHGALSANEVVISAKTMANAILIGKYYLAHAKAAFEIMGTNSVERESRYVLKNLISNGMMRFTRRDVMRKCRRYKTASDVQPVLDHLEEYEYIELEEVVNNGSNGSSGSIGNSGVNGMSSMSSRADGVSGKDDPAADKTKTTGSSTIATTVSTTTVSPTKVSPTKVSPEAAKAAAEAVASTKESNRPDARADANARARSAKKRKGHTGGKPVLPYYLLNPKAMEIDVSKL